MRRENERRCKSCSGKTKRQEWWRVSSLQYGRADKSACDKIENTRALNAIDRFTRNNPEKT